MDSSQQPRQLIVFCDGTNNNLTGGSCDTNVVKLTQLLAQSAEHSSQVFFYDPGVGNPGELPGATLLDRLKRHSQRLAGLAFGSGVYENMADCYRFLMQQYRPGDQLYFFGFSRGAFTARSVAGLVNQFGILRPHMESMLPTLIHTYFADRDLAPEEIKAIANQTSQLFADAHSRSVDIQFVGVWDTVASVGMWPFGAKMTAVPTIVGKHFLNVRQALALDEHRAQFLPRLYVDNNGEFETASGKKATLIQQWFRGSHCDVGGGYTRGNTLISDQALVWLTQEAINCELGLWHRGRRLGTKGDVAEALATPSPGGTLPCVHSELHVTPLWAVTGLAVRDTEVVKLDNGDSYRVRPVEHESVARELAFPKDTVWERARPKGTLVACVLLVLLLVLAQGEALNSKEFVRGADVLAWLERIKSNYALVETMVWMQLTAVQDPSGIRSLASPSAILWALVWDTFMIPAYAYVVSWFAVAGFASLAGLHRVNRKPPLILKPLGWAVVLLVFSDLAENLTTSIMLWASGIGNLGWEAIAAFIVSMLSVFKLLGLFGALMLALGRLRN